ncbi:MAG: immunoglobulin domain-containing protein [Verrucomicrobia bacterium]|nr:immunoglobulin domain-containing protein [Verrucomicrobiota bacterium]
MKTQQPSFRALVCALMALTACGTAISRAETVTLKPSADACLFELAPTSNMGGDPDFVAGALGPNGGGKRARGLIKFDFAGKIPANATITSATLTLTVTKVGTLGAASTFDLHRLLTDWGEGNKTGNQGSPAAAGQSTWNNRFHPATAWTTPGGAAGTDFTTAVSASKLMNARGSYAYGPTAELAADVQAWVRDTASNFGWILITQSESKQRTARRIGAREGSAASAPTLVVEFTVPTAEPPVITQGPANQTVVAGNSVTFTVTATGTEPLTYVWKRDGAILNGQTSQALTINPVQASDAGTYTVEVTNAAGGPATASATLAVLVPPAITAPPQSQAVDAGSNVTFTVAATGSEPLSYVWKHDGNTISGQSTSTLQLTGVTSTDAGTYTVEVSNAAGGPASASATLTVNTPVEPPQIGAAQIGDGSAFGFNFVAQPNHAHIVQSRDSLATGDWATVKTFPAETIAKVVTFTDDRPATAPVRLYRVGVLP